MPVIPPIPWPRSPRSSQVTSEAAATPHAPLGHGPVTQPPAVGGFPYSGAHQARRCLRSQALTRREALRRPRASPAGTRHRRPSPHPLAPAAPGVRAHPGSARRNGPRGAEGRGQRLLEGGHRRAWTPSAVKSSGNGCATSRRDFTIIALVSACHLVSYIERYSRSISRETL